MPGLPATRRVLVQLQVTKLDEILLGIFIAKTRLLGCCSLNTLQATLSDRNQKRFVVCTTTRSTETTPHQRCPIIGQVHAGIYINRLLVAEHSRPGVAKSQDRGLLGRLGAFPEASRRRLGCLTRVKTAPRASQDAPRAFQERSGASKTAQEVSKTGFWQFLGAKMEPN